MFDIMKIHSKDQSTFENRPSLQSGSKVSLPTIKIVKTPTSNSSNNYESGWTLQNKHSYSPVLKDYDETIESNEMTTESVPQPPLPPLIFITSTINYIEFCNQIKSISGDEGFLYATNSIYNQPNNFIQDSSSSSSQNLTVTNATFRNHISIESSISSQTSAIVWPFLHYHYVWKCPTIPPKTVGLEMSAFLPNLTFRTINLQQTRNNVPAENVEQHFLRSFFIPFLDTFLLQLNTSHNTILKNFCCLIPKTKNPSKEQEKSFLNLHETYIHLLLIQANY
ncbi:hypothetical protein QTP88_017658 [Uroleucon formosanum]